MFDPTGQCPDPYGKLATYQTNFIDGVKKSNSNEISKKYARYQRKAKMYWNLGWICFLLSAFLILVKIVLIKFSGSRGSSNSKRGRWVKVAKNLLKPKKGAVVLEEKTGKVITKNPPPQQARAENTTLT